MPTILYKFGYRFFFYSNEHLPVHVHIEKDDKVAKFNLEPIVELEKSKKFSASELKEIRLIIEENINYFKDNWNEFFSSK